MRQLIYSSRWSDIARQDMDLTLQQVVGQSIQNNRLVDVTGFLVARDGLFLQLLEGPERSVGDTFKRISGDARHNEITVVSDTATDRRLFKQWNMAGAQQAGTAPRVLNADSALTMLLNAAEQQLAEERQQLLRYIG
jgi:hypothetical protein